MASIATCYGDNKTVMDVFLKKPVCNKSIFILGSMYVFIPALVA